MATVTKTWSFTSDAEGLADVGDSAITFQKDPGDASVHFAGAASGTTERGRRASTGETWETWGVPAGAVVSAIQITAWQGRVWGNFGGESCTLTLRIVDSSGTTVHSAGELDSAVHSSSVGGWTAHGPGTSRAVDGGKQASTTDVRLEIQFDASTATPAWDVGVDEITLEITYSGGPTPPTDAARATTSITTASDPWTVNLPTHQADDLLVLYARTGGNVSFNTPAGWTALVSNDTSDASDDRTAVFYRYMTGSIGSTMSLDLTGSAKGAVTVWAISDAADPATQPPEVNTVVTSAAANVNPGSITPTGGPKAFLYLILGGEDGETQTFSNGALSNVTNANSGTAGAVATNCRIGGGTIQQIASSSYDPAAWTVAAPSTGASAWTIAIHPPSTSTPKAGTDTGSGADASTEKAVHPRTDSASGADTKTASAAHARADSAVGSDASAVRVPKASTDTGSGTDASARQAAYLRTDAGTGADSIKAKASVVAQPATGTEVSSEHAAYTRTDSGTGTEIAKVARPVADTGAGSEASSLHVAYARTDTGSGADAKTGVAAYAKSDAGTGADASSVARRYAVTDTGTGTEASAEHAAFAKADTGSGADASALQAGNAKHGTDTGTGADVVTGRRVVLTDSGSAADTSSVNQGAIPKAGTDAGSGSDSSTLRVALAQSEVGAGNDLGTIHASLSRTDAGTGTDLPRILLRATDTGTGLEASLTRNLLQRGDSGTSVEVVAHTAALILADLGIAFDTSALFTGIFYPPRPGAEVEGARGKVSIRLNRGGEGSTIPPGGRRAIITSSRPQVEVEE